MAALANEMVMKMVSMKTDADTEEKSAQTTPSSLV